MTHVWTHYDFRYKEGEKDLLQINVDYTAARRLGDFLAERLGLVHFYAYNDMLRRWDYLGDFLGDRKFRSSLGGEMHVISEDYECMRKGGDL